MWTALLGLVHGARHAVEPDHLAAVATLVAEERKPLAAARIGAWWGLGHTGALLLACAALAAVDATMPDALSRGFEALVGAMLVGLGARAVWRAATDASGPSVPHQHGPIAHAHAGDPRHVHLARWTFSLRPLLVGLVHGLAGSGALTALVLAELPDTPSRLLAVAWFGWGSVVGMAALSGAAGLPMAALARRPEIARGLTAATGMASVIVGVLWGAAALG